MEMHMLIKHEGVVKIFNEYINKSHYFMSHYFWTWPCVDPMFQQNQMHLQAYTSFPVKIYENFKEQRRF